MSNGRKDRKVTRVKNSDSNCHCDSMTIMGIDGSGQGSAVQPSEDWRSKTRRLGRLAGLAIRCAPDAFGRLASGMPSQIFSVIWTPLINWTTWCSDQWILWTLLSGEMYAIGTSFFLEKEWRTSWCDVPWPDRAFTWVTSTVRESASKPGDLFQTAATHITIVYTLRL